MARPGSIPRAGVAPAIVGGTREVSRSALTRVGAPTLVAAGALAAGWWLLPALSVAYVAGPLAFTFWQLLPAANGHAREVLASGLAAGGAGGLGVAAVVAAAAPLAPAVWRDRRAHLGGVLPLLLMLLVAWKLAHLRLDGDDRETVHALGRDGAAMVEAMAARAAAGLRKSVTLGPGAYASGAAALYLAVVSLRRHRGAARAP